MQPVPGRFATCPKKPLAVAAFFDHRIVATFDPRAVLGENPVIIRVTGQRCMTVRGCLASIVAVADDGRESPSGRRRPPEKLNVTSTERRRSSDPGAMAPRSWHSSSSFMSTPVQEKRGVPHKQP